MSKNYIWIGLLTIIVVVVGAFLLLNTRASNLSYQQSKSKTQKTIPTVTQTPALQKEVMVTSSGFQPQTITIAKGTRVVWINQSGSTASVNSDIYPTNLLWPFLNLGAFQNGSSVSVLFKKSGTYTYHNHLNPSQKGTVVVK